MRVDGDPVECFTEFTFLLRAVFLVLATLPIRFDYCYWRDEIMKMAERIKHVMTLPTR